MTILEDLGFTNAEIKVYLALLELGSTTAGPIIDKSKLQSSVVYATIHRLIDKGLVSFIKEGKRNYYQASDPKHISQYIDAKKEEFEHYLPQLLAKQETAQNKKDIVTFRGIRGIRELLFELLDGSGKDHHTFGSSKESLMIGEGFWKDYHKKRAKKGIHAKLLFNESLRKWCDVNAYPKTEYKFTSVGFEPLTETIIRGDRIGIILWTTPPLGILIHNGVAAASYDKFWKFLWDSN